MAKVKVDFTGVEGRVLVDEGEYIAVIKSAEVKPSSAGNDMIVAKFEIVRGSFKGAVIYHNFTLIEKKTWGLKTFLEAAGLPSAGRLVVDTDKMAGKPVIINVYHEEYQGSQSAKIANDGFRNIKAVGTNDEDEDEDDDDEEEAPPVKKKKPTSKAKPAPEPEDDDDDEDEEEEEAPAPKAKAKAKPATKKSTKAAPVADDDDEWDD